MVGHVLKTYLLGAFARRQDVPTGLVELCSNTDKTAKSHPTSCKCIQRPLFENVGDTLLKTTATTKEPVIPYEEQQQQKEPGVPLLF